jgi:hypothetical protein
MTRVPLASSVLAAAGYDPSSRTLELEYRNGRVYRYFDVPEFTYRALLRAPSVGRFVKSAIREAFRFEEV